MLSPSVHSSVVVAAVETTQRVVPTVTTLSVGVSEKSVPTRVKVAPDTPLAGSMPEIRKQIIVNIVLYYTRDVYSLHISAMHLVTMFKKVQSLCFRVLKSW